MTLKKMVIESYKDVKFSALDGRFTVMFNPNSYTRNYAIEYADAQADGSTGEAKKFNRIRLQDYTFELIFDGTGASGPKVDVEQRIQTFLRLTGLMASDTHRPPFLILSWGKLVVKCVLKSVDVNYTLFTPGGTPLRATATATFSQTMDDVLRVAVEGKNSPDLTHVRKVTEGDHLPLMTHRIYGDPSHYAAVARYNDLDHLWDLKPGLALKLPPVKDLESHP